MGSGGGVSVARVRWDLQALERRISFRLLHYVNGARTHLMPVPPADLHAITGQHYGGCACARQIRCSTNETEPYKKKSYTYVCTCLVHFSHRPRFNICLLQCKHTIVFGLMHNNSIHDPKYSKNIQQIYIRMLHTL